MNLLRRSANGARRRVSFILQPSAFILSVAALVEEGLRFRGGGEGADEIEAGATEEGCVVAGLGGEEIELGELAIDEVVDQVLAGEASKRYRRDELHLRPREPR